MRPRVVALLLVVSAAACGRRGASGKWSDETGDIPFAIGRALGDRLVESTGRPPLYFFTATW